MHWNNIEKSRRLGVAGMALRVVLGVVISVGIASAASAQETLPWEKDQYGGTPAPAPVPASPQANNSYGDGSAYNSGPVVRNAPHDSVLDNGGGRSGGDVEYYEQLPPDGVDNGAPRPGYDYQERRDQNGEPYDSGPPPERGFSEPGTYSQDEIKSAGHRFFGSVSQGLANVIEHAFRKSGRPNGYILGEDAGGAFVAGLRYGEGRLFTRDAGTYKVYWQGPSLGYDFGGEGSKTMVLVYNLRDPSDIYRRFGGVQGSAYIVGGVGIQYQQNNDIVLAPIRSGVGLRVGANVGYLKYTRRPTWNPF